MTSRPAPSGHRLASVHGLLAVFASLALLCAFAWPGVAQAQPRATPWISVKNWEWGPQDEGRVARGASAQLDVNRLLGNQNAVLDLELPGNELLVLRKTGQDVLMKGAFTWRGVVQTGAGGTAYFTVVNGVAFGTTFEANGRILRVRQKDDKLYAIEQIDQSKFRSAQRVVEIKRPAAAHAEGESLQSPDWCATTAARFDEMECWTDSPDSIDVLVLYTPAARDAALTTSGIQAQIVNAVAVTNSGYTASGIFQQIRLRAAVEVQYVEAHDSSGQGIVGDDLCNLHDQAPNDFVFSCERTMTTSPRRPVPMAEALRDQHAADAVVMITGSNYTGYSYQTTWVGAGAGADAYSVIPLSGASVFFALAHELGHVMGARHDWDSEPGHDNEPYHFNRGQLQLATTPPGAVPWFTVMAEAPPMLEQRPGCARPSPLLPSPCVRKGVWSNPDILDDNGNPTGVATEPRPADNRRTLNCTAIAVANFRCSSPTPGRVWMKDAWSDTGSEPEASLASAPMWKSPYIWIRTAPDTNRIHAHQHENPVFGQANWAYVKIHNSGTASASGALELYYADASLNLVWPDDWKLISSVPVASFPGASFPSASTKILEFAWNNLPGAGHFCLLARWVGSGTVFTTPEGPDIDPNVRGNNTIVWRNVNVIDLSDNAAAGAELLVKGPDDSSAGSAIEIRAVARAGQRSFFDFGKVMLELEETLRARDPARARRLGPPVLLASKSGVVLSDLNLAPGAKGRIRLTFLRSSTARHPRGTYEIDVVQTRIRNGKKIVVGGVTYEVHTDRSARP